MSDKGLLNVIESLLEADMTKKDSIKNPQEEEKEMEEAAQNSVNSKNQVTDQKDKQKTSADTQGVLGKDGKALDAGGDKDEGGSKGDNASDASSDTQGVLGKDGKALDAGGDKDVGGKKGSNASAASSDTQGVLGKDGKALDAGGDKDVGKLKEEDESEDDAEEVEENKGVAGDCEDTGVLDAGGDKDENTKLKEEDESEEDEDEVEEDHVPGANDNSEYGGKGEKTSADTQGVLGKEKGAALDAGGDKDVGKLKEEDESEEQEEELKGDQHKLDVDNDGDIGSDDLAALRSGKKKEESVEEETDEDEGLEESFKEQAQIIFETAVNEKAGLIREEIEAEFETKLSEEKAALDEKVSEYLDYAVKEWISENALEIKYSLRTEIAENFIRGLKGLFEENYIEIPEEEVSVVDELTEAVESYKEQLEEQRIALSEANAAILEHHKESIVEELSEGLTQTQSIRLESLAEAVEADDIEEFRYKVEALREGYFSEDADVPFLGEEVVSTEEFSSLEESTGPMDFYANFLSKTVQK